MARYTGAVCRFCRREGDKLYLKGDRCYTDKCAFERKAYAPGMHGVASKRNKLSEFGTQLREKQKARRAYGMGEKQFRSLFDDSANRRGVTSELFFQALELRLDNVVFRMGFARSRSEARQLVRHNHLLVNGSRCNIPSARMKVGDVLEIKDKSHTMVGFGLSAELYSKRVPLGWFQVDHGKFSGKIVSAPTREDIQMPVKDRLIVELYSK